MATNTLGQFLIAEHQTETVHVYNNNGIFQYSFNPQTFRRDNITQIKIADLVTEDVSEKIYLLVEMFRESRSCLDGDNCEVQVFNKTPYPLRRYKFPAKIGHRLIVSGSKLAILGSWEARVYDQNGELDRSFEFFKRGGDKELADCTATYEGRILIMHNKGGYSDYHCVHVFTMEGQEIAKFRSGLGLKLDYMRFSPRSAGEHVVIAGYNKEDEIITVEINTVDGKFERRILLRYNEPKLGLVRITVTVEGHIALSFYSHADRHGKVAVFKN